MNNEEQYENLELGKTYNFMGYKWTACELINNGKTLVIQSHGVTYGEWPGYKMSQFGNGNYYANSIDGQDISDYDDKMRALYDSIKDVEDISSSYGKGLYLVSIEKVGFKEWSMPGSGYYWTALREAVANYSSFGAPLGEVWFGTIDDSNHAFCVNLGDFCYFNSNNQWSSYMVAPTFNLDLSKVEIEGDEIVKKTQPALSSKHDDNCSERPHLGKTYDFMGYKWTACELINNGKTIVIQSHGVTRGAWPGLVISQFGNGNYYSKSIDGQDISGYDNKLKELYNAIKDAEDSSASYGKGLFLISKEKVGFTEFGEPGSGNYWAALKAVAENVHQLEPGNNFVWLGTVDGSAHACCLHSSGSVHGHESGCNQNLYYVIAPAFNLDLSKVEIKGDVIIKKSKFDFASMAVATPSDNNLSANSNNTSMSAADAKTLFKDFAERLPSDTTLINQVTTNSMIARIKCSKYSTQIANTLNMHFATSNSLYSALSSECSVLPEILLMLQDRGCETHYLGNILLAFIPENVSFPEIDCLYNLPKNSFFTNITVDRSTGEVVIEYNSANNGDAEFFRSLFAVCQGTIKYINIVPRDVNTNLFNENYNSCGIHIDSVTDDSAVENRKAQFIIAEQGIAELAGAVTTQSDSSKELTDDDRLVELCKEASQRAASDDSYVPNLVLQICKRFNWDVNERYDDVEEILSQIVSTGLQITSETVSKSDIFERMFCLLTNLNFTDFIHNYTEQPASADSPKKMDL
jgi:hypothetical protein